MVRNTIRHQSFFRQFSALLTTKILLSKHLPGRWAHDKIMQELMFVYAQEIGMEVTPMNDEFKKQTSSVIELKKESSTEIYLFIREQLKKSLGSQRSS